MIKVTSVNKVGLQSYPASVEINEHGYVLVPEIPGAVEYHIYAPLKGFEEDGPWYLFKSIKRRDAKAARFTIAAICEDGDLLPSLFPPLTFEFPVPVDGQEYWALRFGSFDQDFRRPASMWIQINQSESVH